MSIHAVSAAFKFECPSPTAKLVLLALANYADADGLAYPSVKRMTVETGLCDRAVRKAIKALADIGALEIVTQRRPDGSQKSSQYRLTPQTAPDAVCGGEQTAPRATPPAPHAPLTTFEPSLEPSPLIVAKATATEKTKVRTYPEAFEAAWKAYPHHKGRSSKPNAATEWARLPADERAGLVAAITRFTPNVAETCGGKGAPDMARWLKDGKHLGWQADSGAVEASTFRGPPELRASIVRAKDEDFARRWLDHYCTWDPENRILMAKTPTVAATLTRELNGWAERTKVTISSPANDTPAQPARGAAA